MLDIKEGDILVVAGVDYPVKAVSEWTGFKSTAAFKRNTTIKATTKRATTTSGKRSAATANLTSLKITPLDPVSAELASTVGLGTPHELKKCYCGDDTGFLRLIVEDQKR